MPRASSKEQRDRRNALILRLFLTGNSARQIATHPDIRLSHVAVSKIIRAELDESVKHVQLLSKEALTMHVQRMELLIRAVMPKALNAEYPQQMKAAETARRLLADQARFYGIDTVEAVPQNPGQPIDPDEKDDNAPSVTALDEYRKKHR